MVVSSSLFSGGGGVGVIFFMKRNNRKASLAYNVPKETVSWETDAEFDECYDDFHFHLLMSRPLTVR